MDVKLQDGYCGLMWDGKNVPVVHIVALKEWMHENGAYFVNEIIENLTDKPENVWESSF